MGLLPWVTLFTTQIIIWFIVSIKVLISAALKVWNQVFSGLPTDPDNLVPMQLTQCNKRKLCVCVCLWFHIQTLWCIFRVNEPVFVWLNTLLQQSCSSSCTRNHQSYLQGLWWGRTGIEYMSNKHGCSVKEILWGIFPHEAFKDHVCSQCKSRHLNKKGSKQIC